MFTDASIYIFSVSHYSIYVANNITSIAFEILINSKVDYECTHYLFIPFFSVDGRWMGYH